MDEPSDKLFETAASLGRLLAEHKAREVAVLDLRGLSLWTDLFVVATSTSAAHQDALARHIKEGAAESGLELLHHSGTRRTAGAAPDDWKILDLGNLVIHIMSEKARAFYDLERLWSEAAITRLPPAA